MLFRSLVRPVASRTSGAVLSHFIVSFDTDLRDEIVKAIRAVPGVVLTGMPQADGTVRIKTVTRSLDDESNAVHAVEDIYGVNDVRLLEF